MNLIAGGQQGGLDGLNAGVELLCLVGCHLDACYYLQTANKWKQAATLAKATLHPAGCTDVLSRWVDHLTSAQKVCRDSGPGS